MSQINANQTITNSQLTHRHKTRQSNIAHREKSHQLQCLEIRGSHQHNVGYPSPHPPQLLDGMNQTLTNLETLTINTTKGQTNHNQHDTRSRLKQNISTPNQHKHHAIRGTKEIATSPASKSHESREHKKSNIDDRRTSCTSTQPQRERPPLPHRVSGRNRRERVFSTTSHSTMHTVGKQIGTVITVSNRCSSSSIPCTPYTVRVQYVHGLLIQEWVFNFESESRRSSYCSMDCITSTCSEVT